MIQSAPKTFWIGNVSVPFEGKLRDACDVRIENGVVTDIQRHEPSSNVQYLFKDGILLPGFIDIHVNGGGGHMFIDGGLDNIERILEANLNHGTTGVFATTISVPHDQLLNCLEDIIAYKKSGRLGEMIRGLHVEGPFISQAKKGAHMEDYVHPPSVDLVHAIKEITSDTELLLSLAPELEKAASVIEEAKRLGWKLGLAHSEADYSETKHFISSGSTLLTHAFNGMSPISHKHPGPIPAYLESDDTYIEVITDGVHVAPPVIRMLFKTASADKLIIVTDAVSPAGTGSDHFYYFGHRIRVDGYSCFVGENTLAGSALTMLEACRRMKGMTGCTISQLVRMSHDNAMSFSNGSRYETKTLMGHEGGLVLLNGDLGIKASIMREYIATP